MSQTSYGERDYAFGQAMLTLRMNLGVTQAELATMLGITRKAIGRWEAGDTYPKPSHLKALLAFALKQRVFPAGREEEEIRTFWRAARQKVLLDERWLQEVLIQQIPPLEHPPAALASTPAANISLWTVPYARNPHFTGRDELLEQLTQHFAPQGREQDAPTRRAALTQSQAIKGLGGIGKTQIAVEYAYRALEQDRYTHTLWISAANEETILHSFIDLASLIPELHQHHEQEEQKLARLVVRWLEQCEESWLLLFDNADTVELASRYFPTRGYGDLLLTTRASAVGSFASSIEVETMGLMEGTQFLLHRAQRLEQASDEEINEATNLVIELGLFPLAIDQAGAYIEETKCSLLHYRHLYQQHRQLLLARRGKHANAYPDSVATTWSLSFRHVEHSHPAAAQALQLCAFLAPDHIPEELLIDGAPFWPEEFHHAAANPLLFDEMLEALLAFSLVKRLTEERQLSIHRLVQAVQIDRLPTGEQQKWAERVLLALTRIFPRDPEEQRTWLACQRYLEQAQTCSTLIQRYQLRVPEAADLLDRVATYLRERALYEQAELLAQHALTLREHLLGSEHLDTATSVRTLANIFHQQGKYEQAEPLYQRALAYYEQQLGPQHPSVAEILNPLAILSREQGKYEQAELLAQRALTISEQQLGLQHPDTAESAQILGNIFLQQGKYEQAEPLYQRALAISEQQLGPEHLDTASRVQTLALLYLQQGKYEQSELLYQRVLAYYEQQLGPQHPHTATSLVNLASLYNRQEKYEQAELLASRALAIREQQLGPEHPHTGHSLYTLASVYQKQGKYEQAEALYRRALHISEQHLGPEHPQTGTTLHYLASLYQEWGKYEQAEALYLRALHIRQQALGPEHPRTETTRKSYMSLLQTLGRTEEAT